MIKNRSKNILFINYSMGDGGTQKMFINVLMHAKTNNRKKIIYLYNNNMIEYRKKKIYYNTARTPNRCLTKIPYRSYSITTNYGLFNIVNRLIMLIHIIRKENIDLIFSFSTYGALLAVLAKLSFPFNKIQILVRLGSPFNNLFQDTRVSQFKNKIIKSITRSFTYRFVDNIVCTTQYMKHDLISTKYVFKKKICVIKNFIDKNHVTRLSREKIDIKEKYILYVGRLEKEKNVPGIISVFNKIKDEYNVNLLILGDGSLYNSILTQVKMMNLKDRVKLLGYIDNPYKYMANAECIILFSDYEGSPNVIIEAQYCGAPVVSSKFGGVYDIISNGRNGLLVDIKDQDELTKAVKSLLSNKSLRNKVIKGGKASSLEYANSIIKYEALLNHYSNTTYY